MIGWLFIVAVILVALGYIRYWFSYWQRMGFPNLRPTIPVGCLGPVVLQKQGMGEVLRDVYLKSNEPFLGIYLLFRPTLLVRDPVLLKRIFTTDFEHFTDRGLHYDEENDPIGAHLFAMPGKTWKELRAKLTPTFSSGKLKYMFHTVAEQSVTFKTHLDQLAETKGEVQIKCELVKLNMNIIASVFFGFDLNVFEDPNHPFAKIGDTFMDPNIVRNNIVQFLFFLCPSLMKKFKIPFLSDDVAKYVLNLFNSVLEARKKDPSMMRNDFIQTVLELMEEDKDNKLSVEKCAAQAFIFYLGGYETSASTVSFCMWELCKNPEWMRRARSEVDELMKKRNGKLQYDDLTEFRVLDKCIREGMRKYPVLPFLTRECTKEYPIPDSKLTITKGTSIFIPTYGLNWDPEIFPEPERFDPNRFTTDGLATGDDRPFYPVELQLHQLFLQTH